MTSTDALLKESEVHDKLVALQASASIIISKVSCIEENQRKLEDARLLVEQVGRLAGAHKHSKNVVTILGRVRP